MNATRTVPAIDSLINLLSGVLLALFAKSLAARPIPVSVFYPSSSVAYSLGLALHWRLNSGIRTNGWAASAEQHRDRDKYAPPSLLGSCGAHWIYHFVVMCCCGLWPLFSLPLAAWNWPYGSALQSPTDIENVAMKVDIRHR